MTHTKYPQACKALIAFMLEADNFNPWIEAAQGYLTHCLNAYDKNPIWTSDPKSTPYRRRRPSARSTAGGLGSVGEKAASAIADFVVLDMFASYCTGREDAKARSRSPNGSCSGSIADDVSLRTCGAALTALRRMPGAVKASEYQ